MAFSLKRILCALSFNTVITGYDCKLSCYKREESSFVTSQFGGFEWSVFSRINGYNSCNIHDLATGISSTVRGLKSSNQKILTK